MPRLAFLAVLLLLPVPARAEVAVRFEQGKVDLKARAPVSEILDGLARQTGMKVVYDGSPPRAMVATDLKGLTTSAAVASLLEGLGLSYVVVMDRTGNEVATLYVLGSGPSAAKAGAPGGSASPAAPMFEPPPMDDTPPPDDQLVEEEPPPPDPETKPQPPMMVPPGDAAAPVPQPGVVLGGPAPPWAMPQPPPPPPPQPPDGSQD